MTCEPAFIGKFVNVYLTDRAFGGPEEGGWWYDTGEAIQSTQFATAEEAERALNTLRAWCEGENKERRSDTSSVLSEGRYAARIEEGPAADYPATRPHYE